MKYWPHKMKMPIGWRTIKTTAAVLLSLLVVDQYGASPAKVVFATIGAMSAVGPTFTASVRECISQICGVSIGALLAILFTVLGVPGMLSVGLGVVGIIALYQRFRIKLAPVLPCLILVNVCLNPDVEVFSYSLGRIWDTAIGLAIGTYINWLVVARRLRRYSVVAQNSITIPDFLSNRFHEEKKVILGISALFILVFFTVYAASCFVTCGKLFSTLFGFDYVPMMIVGHISAIL